MSTSARWVRHRRIVLLTVLALLIGLLPGAAGPVLGFVRHADAPNAVAGHFIVQVADQSLDRDGVAALAASLTDSYGGEVTGVYSRALRGFALHARDVSAHRMAADPAVRMVEQDRAEKLDDVQASAPWGLDRLDQRALPLGGTYVYPGTGAGVTVYVVDSGIRITHGDFGGRATHGVNIVDGGTVADDCGGHGTHVAGIIGGTQFGVAKRAQLVAVKVADCANVATVSAVVQGLDWVIQDIQSHRLRRTIVNLSWGTGQTGSFEAVEIAAEAVVDAGTTLVTSAGNDNADACGRSPARLPAAITVGATGNTDQRVSGTNYGSCLDLFAPGENIMSASHTNDTGAWTQTGTSQAAPHVTGAAALVLENHPAFSPQQVRDTIVADATPGIVAQSDSPAASNRLLHVPPPDQPATAASNTSLTNLFDTYGDLGNHWTGGDETMSVALPDGRVAWFFGDTNLGTVNANGSRPANTPMIHNSVVIQQGGSLVTTLHGGTAELPTSLVGAETDGAPGDLGWWPGEARVTGSQLQVFYTHVVSGGGGLLSFATEDIGIATFALPAMTLQSLTKLPALGRDIGWGAAMVDGGDGYTYVYGAETSGHNNYLHVARAPEGQLLVPSGSPTGAWQFWTGAADPADQWTADPTASARVLTGIGNGFSVKLLNGRFTLVSFDGSQPFTNRIMGFFAERPTGPFIHPTLLHNAPVPAANSYVYNARIHPEQGGFVVSYNVNSLDPAATYQDVHLYRPKFVNVTLPAAVDPGLLPAAPTNLTATDIGDGRVHLTWTAPAGTGLQYWIYERNESLGATWFTRSQTSVTSTTLDRGFLESGAYEIRVSAQNGTGEGPRSSAAWALILIPAPTAAPANLVGTAGADGSADLHWDSVTAAGWVTYSVYQRDVTLGDTDFRASMGAVVSGTSAHVTGLTNGSTYVFRVAAANGGGEGPPSSTVQITAVVAPPPSPTSLVATPNGDGTIGLSWTSAGPGLWYWVYSRDVTDGGSFTRYEYPVASGTTFTAAYLTMGHTYAFYVTTIGVNGAPDSAPSNTAQTTSQVAPPPAPTNLTATPNGDGTLALSWTSSGPGIWYWVYSRDVTAGGSFARGEYPVATGPQMTAGYLTAGHTYAFYVTAFNEGGESAPSNTVQETPHVAAPPSPTSLTATSNNDGTITLSWTTSGPDIWYWVYSRDVTAGQSFTRMTYPVAAATTFTSAFLTGGHTYEYYVTAIGAEVDSAPSNTAQAVSFVPPPAAPTNLHATAGDTVVDLTWTGTGAGVWYWIYVRDITAGGSFTRLQYPVSTGPSFTSAFMTNGHTYAFYVTAIGAGNTESAPSNVVQATPTVPPPPAPTNLTATAYNDGTIHLSWGSAGAGLWYWVYYRDVSAGGSYNRYQYPVASGTTFTASYLTIGDTYAYYVTAINSGGEGPRSNIATAMAWVPPPPAPTLTATAQTDGTIRLNWSSSGSGVMYWVFWRKGTSGNFAKYKYPVTGTTFTASMLTLNQTYYYYVEAIGVAANSQSNTVHATATIPPPTNVRARWLNINTALVEWDSIHPTGWFYLYQLDVFKWAETGQAVWQKYTMPIVGRTYQIVTPLRRESFEFKVTEIGYQGESAFSNTVFIGQQANPDAYVRADLICTDVEVPMPRDPPIPFPIAWFMLKWSARGLTPFADHGSKLFYTLTPDPSDPGFHGWTPIDTDASGYWRAAPMDPQLGISIGSATYVLTVDIKSPNNENWGHATDSCEITPW